MQKILISILVCIIYFTTINCVANENQLTKLENELLNYVMGTLQSSAIENIETKNDLEMFAVVISLKNTISSSAYAMVLNPNGTILAHNIPAETEKIPDDKVTKKVLENRDITDMLVQKVKLDNRDVLDFSLPVFSSSKPREYLGAVRFAIYLN